MKKHHKITIGIIITSIISGIMAVIARLFYDKFSK